MKVVESY